MQLFWVADMYKRGIRVAFDVYKTVADPSAMQLVSLKSNLADDDSFSFRSILKSASSADIFAPSRTPLDLFPSIHRLRALF